MRGRTFEGIAPPSLFHYHMDKVNMVVEGQTCRTKGAFYFVLLDRSELHLAHYVVSLAEKRKPILENAFFLVRQILPLGSAVLWLERRLS